MAFPKIRYSAQAPAIDFYFLLQKLKTMNHTKGKWRVVENTSWGDERTSLYGYLILQDKGSNSANIASVIPCFGMIKEEVKANAMLLAAAPELFEIVKKLGESECFLGWTDDEKFDFVWKAKELIEKLEL